MKHGIYEISFMGKTLFEVYIWIGKRQFGYVETFSSRQEALACFNSATYTFDMKEA